MGKYMRKAKNSKGEIAVIEVTHHKESTTTTTTTTLGVRTRAKTLALQQKSGVVVDGGGGGGGSYLQLRSRRVILEGGKRLKHPLKPVVKKNENCSRMRGEGHSCNSVEMEEEGGGGVEASFGENLLEFEPRERTTRESTPCSLIRDPDNIQTPGSSTKPTHASGANSREPDSTRKHIPAAHEMNDFFAGPEEQQQKQFIDKYNFDPVNEKPLPGRYEWVKVDP